MIGQVRIRHFAGILAFSLLAVFLPAAWAVPGEAYTPGKGSADRQAILEALRDCLGFKQSEMVFEVRHLKVKDDWAWIESNPRSPDGKSRYEPVDALLQKVKGQWRVMNIRPCCAECEEDPECADIRKYYRKLRRLFPAAPREIFPD